MTSRTEDYAPTGGYPTRARSILGMSPREMNVLKAVLAHERVYGSAPLTREVEYFVARMEANADQFTYVPPISVHASALARFGWLTIVSPIPFQRIRATEKCWRTFGFSKSDAIGERA